MLKTVLLVHLGDRDALEGHPGLSAGDGTGRGEADVDLVVQVPATPFAGETLATSGIYEQTGCRLIVVDDGTGQTAEIDPQREFTGEEHLTIVGPDEAVQQFRKRYDVSPTEDREV